MHDPMNEIIEECKVFAFFMVVCTVTFFLGAMWAWAVIEMKGARP